MKLHSPQFQKQLRRGVKKAIRESRELKKEYRRAKKFRTRTNLDEFRLGPCAFKGKSGFRVTIDPCSFQYQDFWFNHD